MKYKKCPRCEINYVKVEEEYCSVCQAELDGKSNCEETDMDLCPYCFKEYVSFDQLMCDKCWRKRNKNITSDVANDKDL